MHTTPESAVLHALEPAVSLLIDSYDSSIEHLVTAGGFSPEDVLVQ